MKVRVIAFSLCIVAFSSNVYSQIIFDIGPYAPTRKLVSLAKQRFPTAATADDFLTELNREYPVSLLNQQNALVLSTKLIELRALYNTFESDTTNYVMNRMSSPDPGLIALASGGIALLGMFCVSPSAGDTTFKTVAKIGMEFILGAAARHYFSEVLENKPANLDATINHKRIMQSFVLAKLQQFSPNAQQAAQPS